MSRPLLTARRAVLPSSVVTGRIAGLALLAACSNAGEGTDLLDTAPYGDAASDTGLYVPTDTTGGLSRNTLVVPHSAGLTLLGPDGSVFSERSWTQLAGDCSGCGGEGSSADGDGLLLSFTTGGGGGRASPGAIARIDGHGDLDFRVDGLSFPHDVIRDPADDTLIVVNTGQNELRWVDGDGSSSTALRSLTSANPDFPANPNGAERVDVEGRTYLLVSHRDNATARITLWDITEAGETMFLWRFPASGALSIPHCPILREVDGQWWLLWAHTSGLGSNDGTVGLAVTSDPTVRPTYVADLVPGDDVGRFTFFRGVELLSDGRLVLTDSGGENVGGTGRVVEATFPDLGIPATGETGASGSRIYEDLGSATEIASGLGSPFEAWHWSAD